MWKELDNLNKYLCRQHINHLKENVKGRMDFLKEYELPKEGVWCGVVAESPGGSSRYHERGDYVARINGFPAPLYQRAKSRRSAFPPGFLSKWTAASTVCFYFPTDRREASFLAKQSTTQSAGMAA